MYLNVLVILEFYFYIDDLEHLYKDWFLLQFYIVEFAEKSVVSKLCWHICSLLISNFEKLCLTVRLFIIIQFNTMESWALSYNLLV